MATIGNFIPSSPEASLKYINADPQFDGKVKKFNEQPRGLLAEEAVNIQRVRKAIESHRSKKYLLPLLNKAKMMIDMIKLAAEQQGIDVQTLINNLPRRQLDGMNPLLANIGLPPAQADEARRKEIMKRIMGLEEFMRLNPEAGYSQTAKWLSSPSETEEETKGGSESETRGPDDARIPIFITRRPGDEEGEQFFYQSPSIGELSDEQKNDERYILRQVMRENEKDLAAKLIKEGIPPPVGVNRETLRNWLKENEYEVDSIFRDVVSAPEGAQRTVDSALLAELFNGISERATQPSQIMKYFNKFFREKGESAMIPSTRIPPIKKIVYDSIQRWKEA